MTAPVPLSVEKGSLLAYRMYDVADEVHFGPATTLLKASSRMRLTREGSQYLELPNPPLSIALGERILGLRGGELTVQVSAHVFDHGAISVVLKIPLSPGTDFDELVRLSDEVYDSTAVDQLCKVEASALEEALRPALERPHKWEGFENYTVVFVQSFAGSPRAKEVLERADIARLLLGETSPKTISEAERYDVVKHAYSYFDDDLAVVDWNSAFVYEPSGSMDIPDILEIATAQLLELRYYDALLDRELAAIYDEMAERHRGFSWLFRSKYAALARKVMSLLLELAEFTERVENSLKIIGDFYLARVYRAGVRRFRIPSWQESVLRKQALVAQVYTLLKDEVDIGRQLLLEMTIVALIVGEIALALRSLL